METEGSLLYSQQPNNEPYVVILTLNPDLFPFALCVV
jgi:hypothetical protein